jgi:ABC-type bacteriocin/lantibiotic exporter with double-glycine peptidase domain
MSLQVNSDYVAKQASAAASEIVAEIEKVHGPIWASRQELCKLIITLASAVLVGTITFAEKIIGSHNTSYYAGLVLLVSWSLFFVSICSALLTIWYAGVLQTLRARFANAEPHLKEDALKIQTDTLEELVTKSMDIMKKYSDAALNAMVPADEKTAFFTGAALSAFCLGLAVFIICGALQVT